MIYKRKRAPINELHEQQIEKCFEIIIHLRLKPIIKILKILRKKKDAAKDWRDEYITVKEMVKLVKYEDLFDILKLMTTFVLIKHTIGDSLTIDNAGIMFLEKYGRINDEMTK